MKARFLIVLLGIVLASTRAWAVGKDEGRLQPPDEEKMKLWGTLLTPNEYHHALGELVGEWNVEIKVVMPGVGEAIDKATAKMEWLIPGRWVSQRLEGKMMGQDYQGFGIFGYDKNKNNHVACWVDTMSPELVTMSGTVVDPTGKIQVSYGRIDEFLMSEQDKPVKYVTRRINDDEFEFEVWDLGIGENGQMVLHYAYERKK